jgi:hypothetical protein
MRLRISRSRSVRVGKTWGGDGGAEDGLAPSDHPDREHHFLFVGVFEDVPAGACAQGHEYRVVVLEQRHHKDPDVRAFLQDPTRGLYAVYLGHLQVHQDHVGLQLRGTRAGLLARGCLADDLELWNRLEEGDHALPVERVVFGD